MTVLLLPFQFGVLFISFFFFLIAVTRASKTMWNKVGVSDNSCFFPDLRGNVFNFTIHMMLTVGLLYMAFMLRFVPSMFTFWIVLVINGC